MTAFFITTLLIVLLGLGVGAVVYLGMQGAMKERAPQLSSTLAEAARHMNGDAGAPPQALVDLLPEQLAGSPRR